MQALGNKIQSKCPLSQRHIKLITHRFKRKDRQVQIMGFYHVRISSHTKRWELTCTTVTPGVANGTNAVTKPIT